MQGHLQGSRAWSNLHFENHAYERLRVLSLINKATVANLVAGFVIIAGVIGYFMDLESSEMMLLLVGAGIGYLFKNGNINVLGLNDESKATD